MLLTAQWTGIESVVSLFPEKISILRVVECRLFTRTELWYFSIQQFYSTCIVGRAAERLGSAVFRRDREMNQ